MTDVKPMAAARKSEKTAVGSAARVADRAGVAERE
jgi:hypothetical protein